MIRSKSRLETETVILWNEAEPEAMITTSSKSTMNKLEKKGYRFKELRPGCGTFRAFAPKSKCLPLKLKGVQSVPVEVYR